MRKTASLLTNLEFNSEKPTITVLLETNNTKEIRIAMKTGNLMKKHQTPFPIVIEIFDGEIDFGVNNEVLTLTKGDIIALDGAVPHDLKATKDSIVRLTLTKHDKVERVENVIA
jgi:quercetin dioxygenase-like cupin family protein